MFFFMMQPIGIMFEQWFKLSFLAKSERNETSNMDARSDNRKKEIRSENGEKVPDGIVRRMMGYIWVLSFLFITGWPFLVVYLQLGMADWTVPFSIVGWLTKHIYGYLFN
jgi:hypothetical protein